MTRSGRPPVTGQTRKHRIEVRVSEQEKAELLGALGTDQTLSDLLRDSALTAVRTTP